MTRHAGHERSRSPRYRSPDRRYRPSNDDHNNGVGMTDSPVSPRSRDAFGSLLNRELLYGPRPVTDYSGGPRGRHGPTNNQPESCSRGRPQDGRRDRNSHVHLSQASLDEFDSYRWPKLSQSSVSQTPLCSKKTLPCPWELKTNRPQPERIPPKFPETHINIPPLANEQNRTRLRTRLPGIGDLLGPATSDLEKSELIPQQQPSAVPNPKSSKSFYCADCKRWLKTKSELNKHRFRHLKPFYCDVSGCLRKDGFSTKNDLSRHKRSVHDDRSEDRTIYICPLDECGERTMTKLWPRADNFRDHLRRIHNKIYTVDDDLGEYVYQNPGNPAPEVTTDPAPPVRLEPVLTRTDRPHNSIILPGSTPQASANMRAVDAYLIDHSGSRIPETSEDAHD